MNKNFLIKQKRSVRRSVQYALETGKLIRGNCEICGSPDTMAHHDNYWRPLEVRWFCIRHHWEVHEKIKNGNWEPLPLQDTFGLKRLYLSQKITETE